MTNGIGLLSNRVKKVPSTQVDEDRYRFLRLEESEPDLGVPLQAGNFLVSTRNGSRDWSTDILYNEDERTLQLHGSHALKGASETVETSLETVIANFSMFEYGSAKLLIQVFERSLNEKQISELLIIHDGVNASATEYATLFTGLEPLATYDVDVDSTHVVVLASAKTEDIVLEYKVCETLMLD